MSEVNFATSEAAPVRRLRISARQSRAARALLAWSRDELHRESGVSYTTLSDFEMEKRRPQGRTLRSLRETFEGRGLLFMAGGVVYAEKL